ncbi:MAG: ABC transporter permease, partial [Polyangiaceae bacterium]|nr:ABC transporter permease [Polyangiaceae bacterium]
IWSERSGIVNIALEGILLASGLGAVVAHIATGSAWVGLLAGCAVGAALGVVHALAVVSGGADAIVSGLAINLVAAGGTRFMLRALYASSSNSPAVPAFAAAVSGATGGALLVRTLLDPLFLAAVAVVGASAWALAQTRFGLRVRACGEDPSAASSTGVDVRRTRILAVTLGGAIAGLGGVALAYDQHRFESGMSGGRGFIALAAVILSGWRPWPLGAACVGFAALDALQIAAQAETRVAGAVAQALPYVATLVVLGVMGARKRRGEGAAAPAALGKRNE